MYESGICYIGDGRWSKTLMVSDVNYMESTYEQKLSIFSKYCEMLNSLDSDCPIQFSIRSRRYLEDPLKDVYLRDTGDGLDYLRDEINGILYEKMMQRENSLLKEKYLTFSVASHDLSSANLSLARTEAAISQQLRGMGCGVKTLSGLERLKLLSEELRPLEIFDWSYANISMEGSTKDAIAPDSLNFKESPSSYRLSDTHYGQTLYIRDMPAQMGDRLVASLMDLCLNMTISIHIQAMDQNKALELVKRKIAYMDAQTAEEQKKALRSGYDASMVPHELEYSRNEAKELLESMEQQNQKLFRVALLINILEEDKKSLDSAVKRATDCVRRNGCSLGKINYEQEAALNSVLSIGKLRVEKQRTLPTASTAVFVPFTAQELFDYSGNYCGVNANTGNLVLFDRRLLKSKNSIVLGVPGSGKSFSVKRDIVFNFFNDVDSDIVILDPEREVRQEAA